MRGNAAGLEMSGTFLSFAFMRDGNILKGFHGHVKLRHESVFWSEFPKRLKKTGLRLNDLDFIAVTRGPGRFTGIRMGLSVALTWSKVFDIPVFAPTTTDLLQWQAAEAADHPPVLGLKENLLIPNAEALLRYSLKETKKHWHPSSRPPRALYLKESWK